MMSGLGRHSSFVYCVGFIGQYCIYRLTGCISLIERGALEEGNTGVSLTSRRDFALGCTQRLGFFWSGPECSGRFLVGVFLAKVHTRARNRIRELEGRKEGRFGDGGPGPPHAKTGTGKGSQTFFANGQTHHQPISKQQTSGISSAFCQFSIQYGVTPRAIPCPISGADFVSADTRSKDSDDYSRSCYIPKHLIE